MLLTAKWVLQLARIEPLYKATCRSSTSRLAFSSSRRPLCPDRRTNGRPWAGASRSDQAIPGVVFPFQFVRIRTHPRSVRPPDAEAHLRLREPLRSSVLGGCGTAFKCRATDRGHHMKMLLSVASPHEPFNSLVRNGKAGEVIRHILETIHPEASYFTEP